jgi:hypothetical protein
MAHGGGRNKKSSRKTAKTARTSKTTKVKAKAKEISLFSKAEIRAINKFNQQRLWEIKNSKLDLD